MGCDRVADIRLTLLPGKEKEISKLIKIDKIRGIGEPSAQSALEGLQFLKEGTHAERHVPSFFPGGTF